MYSEKYMHFTAQGSDCGQQEQSLNFLNKISKYMEKKYILNNKQLYTNF